MGVSLEQPASLASVFPGVLVGSGLGPWPRARSSPSPSILGPCSQPPILFWLAVCLSLSATKLHTTLWHSLLPLTDAWLLSPGCWGWGQRPCRPRPRPTPSHWCYGGRGGTCWTEAAVFWGEFFTLAHLGTSPGLGSGQRTGDWPLLPRHPNTQLLWAPALPYPHPAHPQRIQVPFGATGGKMAEAPYSPGRQQVSACQVGMDSTDGASVLGSLLGELVPGNSTSLRCYSSR